MARDLEKIGVRIPPQNIDAEMSVLGALMLDKEAIFRILGLLQPVDFYKPTHQLIYKAMLDLAEKSEPIDVVSVKSRLKETKELETVGGMTYLTSLVNTVPTSSSVNHWAKVVQRKRIHRDLISAASHISEIAYDEKGDIEKLLDEAEQKIFGISQNSLQQAFLHVKEVLEAAWLRIEDMQSGKHKYRGVETGFIDLDKKLSGLQKSDLVVLAARPSLGKTTLALDIARRAAKNNIPVGVFSLEMSKDQLIDRLLASEAGVDLWKLRAGNLSDDDLGEIQKAMNTLSKAPIFLDDVASPTVMQIRAMARRLQAQEKKLGLVIVDYLQLIQGSDRSENRVQEVSEISRSLKALAKELNLPVLAISQLSRAVEMRQDAVPKLSDLRESGSIEQDADVVMFIYRPDLAKKNMEKKGIAEIIIAKHRNGPTGSIELGFDENTVSFYDLAKNSEESAF
ncbi:MAG: replicative DNA helicase [bacterium]|nr:replicative DNA helicase [bacterium]